MNHKLHQFTGREKLKTALLPTAHISLASFSTFVLASRVSCQEVGKVFLNNSYQPTWKNVSASISQKTQQKQY
jgi:hypothetical protein